ncbi:MAG: hypothetical protein GMKNLPBB_01184 [Myxococcota bacterium]|nr:hypothetical protein [Myxococcota bacterium]
MTPVTWFGARLSPVRISSPRFDLRCPPPPGLQPGGGPAPRGGRKAPAAPPPSAPTACGGPHSASRARPGARGRGIGTVPCGLCGRGARMDWGPWGAGGAPGPGSRARSGGAALSRRPARMADRLGCGSRFVQYRPVIRPRVAWRRGLFRACGGGCDGARSRVWRGAGPPLPCGSGGGLPCDHGSHAASLFRAAGGGGRASPPQKTGSGEGTWGWNFNSGRRT